MGNVLPEAKYYAARERKVPAVVIRAALEALCCRVLCRCIVRESPCSKELTVYIEKAGKESIVIPVLQITI